MSQDRHHYRFRSDWVLPAPPARVYDVLEDLGSYPTWWREIRRVEQVDEATALLTCRSTLPYDLVFTTQQSRRDRDAGVLEAAMTGDLVGFSRWTIRPSGTATLAVFEEEVEAMKPLLRALAGVARPAFAGNHWLMMRHGRAGLRALLSR
jgi:hypothetical protein